MTGRGNGDSPAGQLFAANGAVDRFCITAVFFARCGHFFFVHGVARCVTERGSPAVGEAVAAARTGVRRETACGTGRLCDDRVIDVAERSDLFGRGLRGEALVIERRGIGVLALAFARRLDGHFAGRFCRLRDRLRAAGVGAAAGRGAGGFVGFPCIFVLAVGVTGRADVGDCLLLRFKCRIIKCRRIGRFAHIRTGRRFGLLRRRCLRFGFCFVTVNAFALGFDGGCIRPRIRHAAPCVREAADGVGAVLDRYKIIRIFLIGNDDRISACLVLIRIGA